MTRGQGAQGFQGFTLETPSPEGWLHYRCAICAASMLVHEAATAPLAAHAAWHAQTHPDAEVWTWTDGGWRRKGSPGAY